MKTRYRQVTVRRWFRPDQTYLVLQVLDETPAPCDHNGIPLWIRPYWRDADVTDLNFNQDIA